VGICSTAHDIVHAMMQHLDHRSRHVYEHLQHRSRALFTTICSTVHDLVLENLQHPSQYCSRALGAPITTSLTAICSIVNGIVHGHLQLATSFTTSFTSIFNILHGIVRNYLQHRSQPSAAPFTATRSTVHNPQRQSGNEKITKEAGSYKPVILQLASELPNPITQSTST